MQHVTEILENRNPRKVGGYEKEMSAIYLTWQSRTSFQKNRDLGSGANVYEV